VLDEGLYTSEISWYNYCILPFVSLLHCNKVLNLFCIKLRVSGRCSCLTFKSLRHLFFINLACK